MMRRAKSNLHKGGLSSTESLHAIWPSRRSYPSSTSNSAQARPGSFDSGTANTAASTRCDEREGKAADDQVIQPSPIDLYHNKYWIQATNRCFADPKIVGQKYDTGGYCTTVVVTLGPPCPDTANC